MRKPTGASLGHGADQTSASAPHLGQHAAESQVLRHADDLRPTAACLANCVLKGTRAFASIEHGRLPSSTVRGGSKLSAVRGERTVPLRGLGCRVPMHRAAALGHRQEEHRESRASFLAFSSSGESKPLVGTVTADAPVPPVPSKNPQGACSKHMVSYAGK